MFSLKAILFWSMINLVVGVGTPLITANLWGWIEKLPVWPSFNVKKWLLSFKYQNNKPKEIFFVATVTTLIAMFLGFLMFC